MKRKVLLCVLDWGLGHATRSLAVARQIEREGHEVILASSGKALALLKQECPDHRFYELPPYDIHYDFASFEMGMLRQWRKINHAIREEHQMLAEIINVEKIDAVISDNRYGCYHPSTRNVFLSHHLRLRLSAGWQVATGLVNATHRRMIAKFHECWIPDFPDHSLSGDLSRTSWSNVNFVGPLTTLERRATRTKKYDVLAVVSGPEPQRSIFSQLLLKQLDKSGGKYLLVHGQPGSSTAGLSAQEVNFMTRNELSDAIAESGVVIARPGYSTIMDLAAVGASAIFVPTPGQTEQLYLADQLEQAGIALCQPQDRLDLDAALAAAGKYRGFPGHARKGSELLETAVANLFDNLK